MRAGWHNTAHTRSALHLRHTGGVCVCVTSFWVNRGWQHHMVASLLREVTSGPVVAQSAARGTGGEEVNAGPLHMVVSTKCIDVYLDVTTGRVSQTYAIHWQSPDYSLSPQVATDMQLLVRAAAEQALGIKVR